MLKNLEQEQLASYEGEGYCIHFRCRPSAQSSRHCLEVNFRRLQILESFVDARTPVDKEEDLLQNLAAVRSTRVSQTVWDEPLSEPLRQRWIIFQEQFNSIPNISIPRWLGKFTDALAIEIHGFSNASDRAIAAVVYLRVLQELDPAHLTLLSSRTKVARIKRLTIARLKLTETTLFVWQVSHIQATFDLEQAPVHLWTDLTITLAWIQGHPSRW